MNLNESELDPATRDGTLIDEANQEEDVDIPSMIVDTEARLIIDEANDSADLAGNYPLGTSTATEYEDIVGEDGPPSFMGKAYARLESMQWLSLFSYNTGIYHNGKTKYSSVCATLTSIIFILFVVIYSFSEIFSFDNILSVIIFEEGQD